jgi:DNA-binding LacI/PurR family transcriptional regulator
VQPGPLIADTRGKSISAAGEGREALSRVTLQTIADRVGVSRMTVSNAFSRPDQLSPAMRQRILAAAEALGYAGPDPAARALARGSTGAVGVLLTESLQTAFTDEIATGFLGAVAAELGPTGLALTLLTTSAEQRQVIPARDVAIDGALIYSCDPNSAGTAWLVRRKLPIVLVDQTPQPGFRSINIDDRSGARAAAQHIVDLGHRRVAILSASVEGPHGLLADPATFTGSHVTNQRLSGWLDALTPAGIRPTVMQQPPYTPTAEIAATRSLLASAEPPTAILCFSDAIAANVIRTAQDAGLRIPEDLSVVGFDDSPLAQRIRPALTTVQQDIAAKGQAAVAALTAEIRRTAAHAQGLMHDPPPTPDLDVLLPTALVVRDSTAAPRTAAPPTVAPQTAAPDPA